MIHKKYLPIIRIISCIILVLSGIVSCSNDQPEKIAAVLDRSKMPQLHATDITTVISDSGITRYRISTPVWDIYDKAQQPYWEFPKGIHLEQFDENLKTEANIHGDYARFNSIEQVWELRGNVKMSNIKGQLFETSQIFWNQRTEEFHTDSLVKITDATTIIKGIGFKSNQRLTKYKFGKITGIFPVEKSGF